MFLGAVPCFWKTRSHTETWGSLVRSGRLDPPVAGTTTAVPEVDSGLWAKVLVLIQLVLYQLGCLSPLTTKVIFVFVFFFLLLLLLVFFFILFCFVLRQKKKNLIIHNPHGLEFITLLLQFQVLEVYGFFMVCSSFLFVCLFVQGCWLNPGLHYHVRQPCLSWGSLNLMF